MVQRKAFLLRIDPDVLDAVQKWADADLRSVNAQIEFLLRRALADAHRVKFPPADAPQSPPQHPDSPPSP